MISETKLNNYIVQYQIISSTGVLGIESFTNEVASKNDQDAIELIRSRIIADGGTGIRVTRVRNLNAAPKEEKKKKKTFWGLVFSAAFICAMLAKLADKLF